jgi:hypothetical protein
MTNYCVVKGSPVILQKLVKQLGLPMIIVAVPEDCPVGDAIGSAVDHEIAKEHFAKCDFCD